MDFRKARVLVNGVFAGILIESEDGYTFRYDDHYLADEKNPPVSLTLPKEHQTHTSKMLFPFFDGLIPEGWLLDVTLSIWKLNERDRMGLLLAACRDCIGNVSIEAVEDENE